MRSLLLLVDLQRDFLGAPGLEPPAGEVVERAARLLSGARALGVPVAHALTTVDPERDARMPHWKASGRWLCVRGTAGHEPPAPLQPEAGEPVVHKTDFSAFSTGELDRILAVAAPDTLVVAGVHLHGCVRATVLDAYARRLDVVVAEDAIGSDDPLHAAVTLRYLEDRAIRFAPLEAILRRLAAGEAESEPGPEERLPAAVIGARKLRPEGLAEIVHESPGRRGRRLFAVPVAGPAQAAEAAGCAREALRNGAWPGPDAVRRSLARLAERLEAAAEPLARQMAEDVGKPVSLGRAEVRRAAQLVLAAAGRADEGASERRGPSSRARRAALGVVAVVTPWNNPVAIPIGKLAPALAFGNAVVWKPAPAATRIALRLLELLRDARVPDGLVALLAGDRRTSSAVMGAAGVDAVSLSGSSRAGWAAQEICATRRIPLQAELGGNNAAIVWDGAELPRAAALIAQGAFTFAGQRCTANRRAVVDARLYDRFTEEIAAASARIRCGDPGEDATEAGPMVSDAACRRVAGILDRAAEGGAAVTAPHASSPAFAALREAGAYHPPALVLGADPSSEVVAEETFGPVLVLQRARDYDEALALSGGVRQGLVAALFGGSPGERERFLAEARAGVLKLDASTADADPFAPFSGWKASGIGPPEHGPEAREFFTRSQAVYGSA
jgi:acyl-CoA reductase-like NAD-dependent aldehyde dehydrogenase/nicotinamidase-related amidase